MSRIRVTLTSLRALATLSAQRAKAALVSLRPVATYTAKTAKATVVRLNAVADTIKVGYFLIAETLANTVGVTDSQAVATTKPQADQIEAQDDAAISIGKNRAEVIAITDAHVSTTGTQLLDSVAFVDEVEKAFARAFSDAIPVSDAHTIVLTQGDHLCLLYTSPSPRDRH